MAFDGVKYVQAQTIPRAAHHPNSPLTPVSTQTALQAAYVVARYGRTLIGIQTYGASYRRANAGDDRWQVLYTDDIARTVAIIPAALPPSVPLKVRAQFNFSSMEKQVAIEAFTTIEIAEWSTPFVILANGTALSVLPPSPEGLYTHAAETAQVEFTDTEGAMKFVVIKVDARVRYPDLPTSLAVDARPLSCVVSWEAID